MNKQSTCFLSLSPRLLTSHLNRGTWKIQAGWTQEPIASVHSKLQSHLCPSLAGCQWENPFCISGLSFFLQKGGSRVPPSTHAALPAQTFWLLVTPPFIRFLHILGGLRHTQISVILRSHRIPWVACISRKERRLGSCSSLTTNYTIRSRDWWHICEDTTLGIVINCLPPPHPYDLIFFIETLEELEPKHFPCSLFS